MRINPRRWYLRSAIVKGVPLGLLLSFFLTGIALAGWAWGARVSVTIETISLDPSIVGVETVWESPIGIGDCSAKLAGKEVKVQISEGHPLARCVVTTQIAAGRLPLRLTDVVIEDETGVVLRYLGDPDVVVDGAAEFTTEIFLTADLPSGAKLQKVGLEYQFVPDYMAP